jgi:Zn-finger nucleic acid-binding protein
MTRVSDRARFCHHCATPIIVQGNPGQKTQQGCPACGKRHKMNGRSLGEPAVSVLECSRCAGLWLSREGFEIVADRARDKTLPDQVFLGNPVKPVSDAPPSANKSGFYRQCPECRKTMNRRNFGRQSGIVVDTCKDHGIWFDAQELGDILKWIRRGGEERVQRHRDDEARHAERLERFKIEWPVQPDGRSGIQTTRDASRLEGLGDLLSSLFDL